MAAAKGRLEFLASYHGVATAEQVLAKFGELQRQSAALAEDLVGAVNLLAVMLYLEDEGVRQRALALAPPLVREMLTVAFEHLRERISLAAALGPLTPPPLAGDTKTPAG